MGNILFQANSDFTMYLDYAEEYEDDRKAPHDAELRLSIEGKHFPASRIPHEARAVSLLALNLAEPGRVFNPILAGEDAPAVAARQKADSERRPNSSGV